MVPHAGVKDGTISQKAAHGAVTRTARVRRQQDSNLRRGEWGDVLTRQSCVKMIAPLPLNLHGCQPVQTGAVMIKARTAGLITSPGRVLKGYLSPLMTDAGTAAIRRMSSVLNLPSARHIQRDEPGCDGHAYIGSKCYGSTSVSKTESPSSTLGESAMRATRAVITALTCKSLNSRDIRRVRGRLLSPHTTTKRATPPPRPAHPVNIPGEGGDSPNDLGANRRALKHARHATKHALVSPEPQTGT